eukprot:Gb_09287 [translate_table: standard]
MAAKVDQTSVIETRRNQSVASATVTSGTTANNSKISMRSAKSGVSFVIPKNKLSGALVPVVRGGGKLEKNDDKKDEEVKQPQRKTKWGIDLTQDAAVKKGRALAYQTRAEQIAAQLELGNLEIDYDEATRSPSPPPVFDASGQQINTREARKREELDLERREAIGECMRLNPNYKPPAGYKPVYKEAKIYIPVKEYPGYNFIGLILGPEGNTQKRLEEETGTKITIQGIGDAKEGKIQGVQLDGKEAEIANEDLHVHVSADTYEKVDAAIALLELLMTPVDGNILAGGATSSSLSGDALKAPDQGTQVLDTGYTMPSSELAPIQPMPLGWPSASGTEAPGGHFQPHPGHWYSMGSNNSVLQASPGLSIPVPNSASHGMNNANSHFPRFPPPAFNSFYPFPFFRGRPPLAGFNPHAMPSNARSPMFGPGARSRPPFHVQQRPYMPEMASQNQSAIMNPTASAFGSLRPQPMPTGPPQSVYPAHPTGSNPTLLRPVSNISAGGGYGPPVVHRGESASAPLPSGSFPSVPPPAPASHVPASVQLSEGAYQKEMQPSAAPPSLVSHTGIPTELPSPRLTPAPPRMPHVAAQPPVASPVVPSPGLSPTTPQGAHVPGPPPVSSHIVPSHGFSPAPPRGVHVAGPPPVPPPGVPSAVNNLHAQPPRGTFMPQGSSIGLSPAPLPVVSANSNATSPILASGGGMHNAVAVSSGLPVAVMQPSNTSRPSGPPPVSAGMPSISSQGSSASSSAAPNTWQPQHLRSGDFTFQPLRSQAPSSPLVWSQASQSPSSADACPQSPVPVARPGFQPAFPSFPQSLPPQIRVNTPPPPAPPTPAAPPQAAPPMPPLPPQAPSFRPAISLPSPTLGISSQPGFPIPPQVPGPQTIAPPMPPPRPPFLGSASQPISPRPPLGVLNSPVVPPFGSSASQPLRPPLPPRPHPGPENHLPFPSVPVPNFQSQEAPPSQTFQHPSQSNVPMPPRGPPPTSSSMMSTGSSSAALPGDVSKQLSGPPFVQQQSTPVVLHNISALPPNNIQQNQRSASAQLQLPASPQPPPIVPVLNQVNTISVSGTHGFDFSYGGSNKTLLHPTSTGEGGNSQSYDPFSPTSIRPEQSPLQSDQKASGHSMPEQSAGGPHDRQDTDAEYENLMESVGVR